MGRLMPGPDEGKGTAGHWVGSGSHTGRGTPPTLVQSPTGWAQGAPRAEAPAPGLTVLCLVQDVEDVGQLQRQLIWLLGHVRVHTLDLGAV